MVSGSDVAFDPPIGPALRELRVRCLEGYDASHLDAVPRSGRRGQRDPARQRRGRRGRSGSACHEPRCRARCASTSSPDGGRWSSTGTHGKTTTSAMCALVALEGGARAGLVHRRHPEGAGRRRVVRLHQGAARPRARRPSSSRATSTTRSTGTSSRSSSTTWASSPDDVVILTSVEHDHIDIYPDVASYEAAFQALVRQVPDRGLIVCDAHDARARVIAAEAKARVVLLRARGRRHGRGAPDVARSSRPRDARRLAGVRPLRRRHVLRPVRPAGSGASQRPQRPRGPRRHGGRLRGEPQRRARASGSLRGCQAPSRPAGRARRRARLRRLRAPPDGGGRDAPRPARAAPGGSALGRVRAAQRDGLSRHPPGGLRALLRRGRPRPARTAGACEHSAAPSASTWRGWRGSSARRPWLRRTSTRS